MDVSSLDFSGLWSNLEFNQPVDINIWFSVYEIIRHNWHNSNWNIFLLWQLHSWNKFLMSKLYLRQLPKNKFISQRSLPFLVMFLPSNISFNRNSNNNNIFHNKIIFHFTNSSTFRKTIYFSTSRISHTTVK